MAEFYGYDLDYIRYRLTLSQALALLDAKTERDQKAQQAAKEREAASSAPRQDGWFDPSTVSNAPIDIGDARRAFGALNR